MAAPHYYNEWDAHSAEWLRNLIAAGHLPAGDVDTRSIADVEPDDLVGYRQCHFFAGIGGWSYAGRLAGWPDDREIWTGSPPCQPFSVAGKQRGQADDRHLWPHLFRLARARRPAVLMGEQVAAAVGKDWLDGVFADLEGIDYACRAVVVPACAVNAPHRRDRLWFVAERGGGYSPLDHGERTRLEGHAGHVGATRRWPLAGGSAAAPSVGALGEADSSRCEPGRETASTAGHGCSADAAGGGGDGDVADRFGERCGRREGVQDWNVDDWSTAERPESNGGLTHGREVGCDAWADAATILCHDGKARRVEPGLPLLVAGLPFVLADGRTCEEASRAETIKGFGNAIVPAVAAELMAAYMDTNP